MSNIETIYNEAVADCLAKKPTRDSYDMETSEGIESFQNDYLAWQRETCTRLLTLNDLLPEEKQR